MGKVLFIMLNMFIIINCCEEIGIMDETEIEQKFDAIYMAITLGHIRSARRAFEASINHAVNDKLNQAIEILENKGLYFLVEDIEELKEI